MRDFVQLGGCRGGGVINWFHSDRERSDGNIGEPDGIGSGFGSDASFSELVDGNMASRWGSVAAISSESDDVER
jgi:hypothetical protein